MDSSSLQKINAGIPQGVAPTHINDQILATDNLNYNFVGYSVLLSSFSFNQAVLLTEVNIHKDAVSAALRSYLDGITD